MPTVAVLRSALLPYSETFVHEQVRSYRSWTPVLAGSSVVDELDLAGLEVEELEPRRVLDETVLGRARRLVVRLAARLLGRHPLMTSRLRRTGADLVHLHFGTDAVLYASTVLPLRVPVVVTLHGFDIHTTRETWTTTGGRFGRSYLDRLVRLSREENVHFVAVSRDVKDAAERLGIAPEKIRVLHIGVDVERFSAPVPDVAPPPRILFTGRMVEKKAPLLLIEAFEHVKARVPAATLTIIGDGPLLEEARAEARRRDLGVEFVGRRTPDEVLEALRSSRAFCLPSVTARNGDAEGFGMVLLEAQACGVPVVTSARGGVDEGLRHGATGYAFGEGDVDALAGHLEDLLTDDAQWLTMSAAAREFVRGEFDIAACTRRLEEFYDELLTTAGREGRPSR